MKRALVFWWCLKMLGSGLLLILMLTTGCGTLPDGRGWGQDAIYPPRWERVRAAAKHALFDPVTWIPALGAGVFAIDDFDQKTSDWATEHTPIFGSVSGADDASDNLKNALQMETAATWLLTPSGSEFPEWGFAKIRGGAVEYGALQATGALTDLGKSTTGRTRPDDSNDRSFPSQHASTAFANARLSNRNLDSIRMPAWARNSLKGGNLVMATGTAWARVEGKRHYPSDVLAGACLGNLVTTFIHDAFMNLPESKGVSFYIEPAPSHVFAGVSLDF